MRLGWGVMLAAAMGCGSAGAPAPARPRAAAGQTAARDVPSWLTDLPVGCELGDSGPTLVPSDALAEARRRARARLVTRTAPVTTKSIEVVSGASGEKDERREVTLEQAQGWVRNSEIVALWYDARGEGPERAPGCAYAVACLLGDGRPDASSAAARDLAARQPGPRWLYAAPAGSAGLCAVGISGPTLEAGDAEANAEAAARVELGDASALHAQTATAIYEDDVVYAAVTHSCDGCTAAAAGARVAGRWLDARGEGPIPFPGTAYALLCLGKP
jgi:hypothetical protein